jgi:serine/threonine protein kinase
VWKRIQHPNIVPFLGVTVDPPQLVSDWMEHGDLMDFLKKFPETNRLGLVCIFPTVHTGSRVLNRSPVTRCRRGLELPPFLQRGSLEYQWGRRFKAYQ